MFFLLVHCLRRESRSMIDRQPPTTKARVSMQYPEADYDTRTGRSRPVRRKGHETVQPLRSLTLRKISTISRPPRISTHSGSNSSSIVPEDVSKSTKASLDRMSEYILTAPIRSTFGTQSLGRIGAKLCTSLGCPTTYYSLWSVHSRPTDYR